jgi:glycosyltransferase involved in cell wall biosynthesis
LLAGQFSSTRLQQEIEQYAGWSSTKYYGFVDRKKIAEIMAKSFCGLVTLHAVPNYVNSQPIKMFEYMSAGVPVIASNFPLWKTIIEGNQCGLCVNPGRPGEIAKAIRYLRDRPDEVARMGENGRRAVERSFRWSHESVLLATLYRDLLYEHDSFGVKPVNLSDISADRF